MEKRPSKNQPEKEKKGKLWNETKKKKWGHGFRRKVFLTHEVEH